MVAEVVLTLAVSRIPRLGTDERLLLLELLDAPRQLKTLSKRGIEELIRRRYRGSWEPGVAVELGSRDAERCTENNIRIIPYLSQDYPPQLREIHNPPIVLFLRGECPDWGVPCLGVVGTRFPTGMGRREAFRVGFAAGQESIPVVSGLARGIDVASHRGNRVAGGRTIAVMAGGLDRIFPAENRIEAREILASGGGLLGEYPPGVEPLKHHFPLRNRIISGLSRWVVIVEAPSRSGALITGKYAIDQDRELFIHPVAMDSPVGAGCRELVGQGAELLSLDFLSRVVLQDPLDYGAMPDEGMGVGERIAHRLELELEEEVVCYAGGIFSGRRVS